MNLKKKKGKKWQRTFLLWLLHKKLIKEGERLLERARV